jgi:hypothetical protein
MERLLDGFADDGLERVLALGSDEFRPGPWSGSSHAEGLGKGSTTRIVVSDFISLDGVVQAPGGPKEDIDGGFRHGGWSMPILLGGGKRLFPDDGSAHPLELVSATTTATGVLICTYRAC